MSITNQQCTAEAYSNGKARFVITLTYSQHIWVKILSQNNFRNFQVVNVLPDIFNYLLRALKSKKMKGLQKITEKHQLSDTCDPLKHITQGPLHWREMVALLSTIPSAAHSLGLPRWHSFKCFCCSNKACSGAMGDALFIVEVKHTGKMTLNPPFLEDTSIKTDCNSPFPPLMHIQSTPNNWIDLKGDYKFPQIKKKCCFFFLLHNGLDRIVIQKLLFSTSEHWKEKRKNYSWYWL